MKRKEITALTENDFIELRKHSLLDSFTEGKLICFSCKKSITIDNLLSFKKNQDKFVFYCNRADCKRDR